ncbi:MAG: hypothetical protein H0V17_01220 [Deltaproteobacteria bacterium]|nr:hypothetical protein [Deltaproteobacteria bacterium]
MRWFVVLLVACGSSSNPRDVPDDHRLHDLSSETSHAKYVRYGGKAVSLADVPVVADKLGLPVSGTADVMIDVTIPKTFGSPDYSKSSGSASITCTKCGVGDHKAKLAIDSGYFASVDFGQLTIDHLEATMTIVNGKLTSSWKLTSPDLEVQVALEAELALTFENSVVRGCIRFRPTALLRKRDPKMHDLLSLTGAARDDEGFDHITLAGTVDGLRRLAQLCDARPRRPS